VSNKRLKEVILRNKQRKIYASELEGELAATSLQPEDIGSTVQAWDADIDAISTLSGTGFPARIASNVWALRSLVGTSPINVSNGDGVFGNPTISIAGAALTKVDDTNVTLTLGGTSSTALVNTASLTLGWTGQLGVTRGGTGLGSVTQGDLLYGSASNTISSLAKDTNATRYLSNTGTSNNPAWAQISLSNGVTGTLPVANGGTGLTSLGSANQLLGVNAAAGAQEYKTLSGTSNQITVTHGVGTITLSTPQDIATGSSPTFAGMTITGATTIASNGGSNGLTLTQDWVLRRENAVTGNLYFDNSGNTRVSVTPAGVVNIAGLTASQAVFTDSSKNLVSNAITGSGNVVMSASPTLTGTLTAANAQFSGDAGFGLSVANATSYIQGVSGSATGLAVGGNTPAIVLTDTDDATNYRLQLYQTGAGGYLLEKSTSLTLGASNAFQFVLQSTGATITADYTTPQLKIVRAADTGQYVSITAGGGADNLTVHSSNTTYRDFAIKFTNTTPATTTAATFNSSGMNGVLGATTPADASVTTLSATGTTTIGSGGTLGALLNVAKASGGGTVDFGVYNSDTANAASHAQVRIYTNGAGSGDPIVNWEVNGVTRYYMGIDNSNSDKLVIGTGYTPGGADIVSIATGAVDITGTLSASGVVAANSGLSVRSSGSFSGVGLDFLYSGGTSYIMSYDNDATVYKPLELRGSAINMNPDNGGLVFGASTAAVSLNRATSISSDTEVRSLNVTSAASAGALITIDNTHANDRGSGIDFKQGGVRSGVLGTAGIMLGTNASDMVMHTESGKSFKIWPNGNISDATAGSVVFGSAGTATAGTFTATGNIGIAATNKIYLDGVALSGDTYIHEASANSIELVSGGTTGLKVASGTITMGSYGAGFAEFSSAGVISSTGFTGTSNVVRATSPTLTTPDIGAATGTSLLLSGLTANSAVFTDGSKNLVSVGATGSGAVVRTTSASLTAPNLSEPTVNHLIITEQGSNPTNPTQGDQAKMWMKTDKLCVSYNAAGTMRYWTLDFSSASTQSWTYSATAP